MDEACELISQDLLCFVELAALPLVHLIDLLERKEGHHAQALKDIRVADVAPVLVEIVRARLVGIQPYGALCRLAHLLSFGVEKKGDGHGVCVLLKLSADQVRAGEHVAPLVVAAELHLAAVFLVQVEEVIGLHQHVVELEEGKAPLKALLIAACAQHFVDGEMNSDITDKLNVVEIPEPVGVIDHLCLARALAELDKAAHLLFEALTVVVDRLNRHHRSEIGSSGGISDHSGSAADQRDRLVSGFLQTLHEKKCHKVADMQRICRRVKTDIERRLACVDQLGDFLFIRELGKQSSCLQLFINCHVLFHFPAPVFYL